VARLIYAVIASLDGYVADENGNFAWAAPDEEVHAFVNELERPIGTYLYGRKLYEVMAAWETLDDDHPVMRDFAELWRAADKIVYSRTLHKPWTAKTHIERVFDPVAVRALKAAAPRDLSVGGSELAAAAFAAGLVDECHFFVAPVLVGGGTEAFPGGAATTLELEEERCFASGMVYLRYRTRA
jgi:dihydrofolate reductase